MKSKYDANSILKVMLTGEHAIEYAVDLTSLERNLNEQFFFVKVVDESKLAINAKNYTLDKSVKGEFVRAVMDSNLSEKEKSEVIMLGISALKGDVL